MTWRNRDEEAEGGGDGKEERGRKEKEKKKMEKGGGEKDFNVTRSLFLVHSPENRGQKHLMKTPFNRKSLTVLNDFEIPGIMSRLLFVWRAGGSLSLFFGLPSFRSSLSFSIHKSNSHHIAYQPHTAHQQQQHATTQAHLIPFSHTHREMPPTNDPGTMARRPSRMSMGAMQVANGLQTAAGGIRKTSQ